jgi:hypothetical protein
MNMAGGRGANHNSVREFGEWLSNDSRLGNHSEPTLFLRWGWGALAHETTLVDANYYTDSACTVQLLVGTSMWSVVLDGSA